MKLSFKPDPAVLITEVLTIVIGILLALAANEWNNQRLQSNKLDAILQMVEQEIDYNLKVMEVIHAKNTEALANLEETDSEKESQVIPGLQIRETAWQTLLT
ncbi:hypothetical protein DXV75_06345 [Alteromonas aestuariivivens]|uniref:Uncharacterized protein n=1 Tax=Alteromonas aestuariivivens TaxID=1938339 RepID=A0A3D8M9F9_9ALTE|nr:hypothetical protein [Alteromonas aestuariivivens]RDV26609.1 hypothetical protein DXV75_06345 [Alteromonas aestuariivivens]